MKIRPITEVGACLFMKINVASLKAFCSKPQVLWRLFDDNKVNTLLNIMQQTAEFELCQQLPHDKNRVLNGRVSGEGLSVILTYRSVSQL